VANAKSHPISIGAQHESAIAFLTDLEEKLDVARVQLEMYNTLLPKTYEPDLDNETEEKITVLTKKLFTMSEVSLPHLSFR
jgi:nuclear pore complex protein Nup155